MGKFERKRERENNNWLHYKKKILYKISKKVNKTIHLSKKKILKSFVFNELFCLEFSLTIKQNNVFTLAEEEIYIK